MGDHGDYLNVEVLKAIPDIIANPIAISEYAEANTISVFGDIFVGGSPMMVGVTISKDRAGNDISKVRTLNVRRDVGKLITDESILYLGEDKKRIREWFQACGIQVPLGETKFGFV
jgi:carbamoylphosphate synthase large subunit